MRSPKTHVQMASWDGRLCEDVEFEISAERKRAVMAVLWAEGFSELEWEDLKSMKK